jgi:hypothetical protein
VEIQLDKDSRGSVSLWLTYTFDDSVESEQLEMLPVKCEP